MRTASQQEVTQQKMLLAQLKEAWGRLNKRYVNQELKNSLYTRMLEVEAYIGCMETFLKKQEAAVRRASTRKTRTRRRPVVPEVMDTGGGGE